MGLDHRLQGRFDESREAFERAIQICDETSPGSSDQFHPLNNLAAI